MEELLKKIEPKWFVIIYGIYIVGRAIQALLDPSFAWVSIQGGYYQWEVFVFKFSYLALTFLHPLIFALVSVELSKREFPFRFFVCVLVVHAIVFEIIGVSHLIKWWHAISRINASTFVGISTAEENGTKIIESQEALKGLLIAVFTPIIFGLALYWWRKPIVLFRSLSGNAGNKSIS